MNSLDGISSIDELNLDNQRVLVRADLDWDSKADSDDLLTRKVRTLLPTLTLLAEKEARVIVAAHRGHPTRRDSAYSLERVGMRLSELSGSEVFLPDDCLSDAAKRVIADLRTGQICLLENLRFHRGEDANDETFARALAAWCDVYVNDAFACAHLRLASTSTLPRLIPMRGCGFGLKKEIDALSRITNAPEHPVSGVLGGPSTAEQLDLLDLFLQHCDSVCVGGGLAWTLLAAAGASIASAAIDDALLPRCRSLLDRNYKKLLLPLDVRTAERPDAVPGNTADVKRIPTGHTAIDIGPETTARYAKTIAAAKTIVYTGLMSTPLCVHAREGAHAIVKSMAEASGFSVITGNETVALAAEAGPDVVAGLSHVSLGEQATLAWIAGKRMPGIEMLRGASNE